MLDTRTPSSRLTVSVDLTAGHITLIGELDQRTAHHLLDAVRTLSDADHRRWVVEAGELDFCDTSGLRAISASYRCAVRHGADMSIVGASNWLRRSLADLKLDTHLLVEQSAGAAR